MVWPSGDSDTNPDKVWAEKITRMASKTVIGQCRGMDRADIEYDVE